MRRYLIRFVIIAALATVMIDINKNPDTHYTTQLQFTATDQIIDMHEASNWASDKIDQLGNVSSDYISKFLKLFGYGTEKGK